MNGGVNLNKIVITALMSATALTSVAAFSAEEVEEVVVTGTLIRGIAPVGSPSATLDNATIVASGTTNTADLLATQPSLNSFNTLPIGGNQAFRSTGSTVPGMRGLPGTAVLVMLDGHRLVGDSPLLSVADPSSIPAAAIERVEIIQDGGSATYGSDAVAGVINIILKKNYSGMETSTSFTAANSYTAGNVSHLMGKTWDGGSALLALSYEKNSDLKNTDRSYYVQDFRPYGGRANLNISCGLHAVGQEPQLNVLLDDGKYYNSVGMKPLPVAAVSPASGLSATTPARNSPPPTTTAVNCDPVAYNQLIIPNRKVAAVGNFRHDVNERLSLFADAKFTDQYSFQAYQPQNLVVNDPLLNTIPGTRQTTGTLIITGANPFFRAPAGYTVTPSSVEQVFVNSGTFGALGTVTNEYRARSYMVDVGATMDLWGDWQATADVNYGHSDSLTFNPVSTGANPNALLAASKATTTATALDPFGGNTNPTVIAGIMNWPLYFIATQKIYDFNLRADGSLFEMPGGEVKMAIGVANRHEKYDGDSPIGAPGQTYYTVNPQSATRTVNAVFAELNVPLVGVNNAFTGVQRLSLSLAGRFDDFSDFGNTTNPKFGITWAPVDSLTVRGSYGTSFHAPQLADTHAIDTRANANVTTGGTTAPTNFPLQNALPTLGFAGGTPDLKPEEATTYSFGLDFKPTFAPGLTLSATYFDIKFENQINITAGLAALVNDQTYPAYVYNQTSKTGCSTGGATGPIGTPVAAGTGGPCYAPIPQAKVDSLLAGVRKLNFFGNPTTWLVSADQRRRNNAANIIHGIDWDFTYRMDAGAGTMSAGLSGEYLLKYLTQNAKGAAFADTLENGVQFFRGDAGAQSIIPWHVRANVGWQSGPFSSQAVMSYTGKYKFLWTPVDYSTNGNGVNLANALMDVDPFITVDVNGIYDFPSESGILKGVRAQLNLYNIFNTRPPFQISSGDFPGFQTAAASPLGRTVRVSLTKSW
jgi:iron complex outermembrane recepter protein